MYIDDFEPLLHYIVTLEEQGLFVRQLGSIIKGTVQCVVADNLGAHGLAGFVEFSQENISVDFVQLSFMTFSTKK